jgi:hypothetical protein
MNAGVTRISRSDPHFAERKYLNPLSEFSLPDWPQLSRGDLGKLR